MFEIKGIEKLAPKDFPGFISSTVFLGGCNFKCPFCHNSDLVLRPHILPAFSIDYFLTFLDARKDWLEGICISGGEPLIHDDIENLIILIKERGLLVKIDTNGSFPVKIENLIQKKLVDHIAMDVKAPLEKYQEAAGSKIDEKDILKSIDTIKNSGIDYTFRTTVVPDLIGEDDIEKIGKMLNGAKTFQLQQFFPTTTIDSRYLKKKPYNREQIMEFAEKFKQYFLEVKVEGV